MAWDSRRRRIKLWCYLGELPNCEEHEYILLEELEPEHRCFWTMFLETAPVELALPDTEYRRDGRDVLLEIPAGCDVWSDPEKIVVLKNGRVCPECHSLLDEFEEYGVCYPCDKVFFPK